MTGKQLQAALDKLGITQYRAAKLLGVSHVSMYRWRHGKVRIPQTVVEAMRGWFIEAGLELPRYLQRESEKKSK